MDVLGDLHVDEKLKDSPFEIFTSLINLAAGITKVGAIG
jgi:hypothetical protein